MIVFRDKVFKAYSINPYTAEITDSNGIMQKTYLSQGRETFKKMGVHKIMADTYLGYDLNKVIHHMDKDSHNNALSNLCLLTPEEHSRLHNKGMKRSEETKNRISEARKGKSIWNKGKSMSEESKKKNSESHKGKKHSEEALERLSESHKGLLWWNNGERNTLSKECPEGFVRGRLKRNR